ncbi:MAG: hypothetical protein M5U26_06045 [Planctomycetota bacterium]|nr:hypothetical protein [Planctomycetota bacterium]
MRTLILSLLALALLGLGGSLRAQDASRQQAAALSQEVHQAFAKQDYARAEQKCRELLALMPGHPNPHYNLACALARQGKNDEALAELGKAAEAGYNDPAHLKADEDLAALRADKRFAEIAAKARENEQQGSYEKGAELAGLKSIEAFPEGGLRYRLRLGNEAGAEKPHRLIVWLHPSGGSMNNVAEGLAPLFAQHGYAIVVFTQKQWMGWSSEDAEKLAKTLPELEKVAGLDAKRPILMGYSAGGQMALSLWGADPRPYGGLVLDAAYPIDAEAYMRGQVKAMDLPKDEAIRKIPVFALVGDKDGGAQMWQKVMNDWLSAGIPLTYRTVAGKGHTWLFGPEQKKALTEWLDQVAAGKFPSDPPAQAPAPKPEAPKPDQP